MMNLKLSKFEKVTIFLVISSVGFLFSSLIFIALIKGIFEPKSLYHTKLNTADGIYSGLDVLLSGFKIGEVKKVEFDSDHRINVYFEIKKKYRDKIRSDSHIKVIRPFILGEKSLEISIGDLQNPILNEGSFIPAVDQFDFINFLTGRSGGEILYKLSNSFGNLSVVLSSLLEKERLEKIVKIIDRIEPTLKNMESMSVEVTKLTHELNQNKKMGYLVKNLVDLSRELNAALPYIKETAPHLALHFQQLVTNLSILSEQFKVIGPAIAQVGPELPQATRRALEALDEAVVLLKALQRSFLIKNHAEEIKKEEKQQRKPALNH